MDSFSFLLVLMGCLVNHVCCSARWIQRGFFTDTADLESRVVGFWKTVAAWKYALPGQRSQRVNKMRYWTSVIVGVWPLARGLLEWPPSTHQTFSGLDPQDGRTDSEISFRFCIDDAHQEPSQNVSLTTAEILLQMLWWAFNYVDWKLGGETCCLRSALPPKEA